LSRKIGNNDAEAIHWYNKSKLIKDIPILHFDEYILWFNVKSQLL
jgi:hypothetical protein